MNIAILIPELGGGGAERVAQRIGDFFVDCGHNVYYFLGDFGIRARYKVKGNVVYTGVTPIAAWEANSYFFTLLKLLDDAQKVKILKRKYDIDVSISFMEHFNAINILSRCKDKIIVRVCTILSMRSWSSCLYNKNLLGFLYRRADRVVVMTTDGQEEMCEIYGVLKRKIVIIPNPINIKPINNLLEQKLLNYKKKTVLVVGRLEVVKQQQYIIRAFSLVSKKVPEAKLIFLGTGPLRGFLQSISKLYGLEDKIFFKGFVKEMDTELLEASIFVMTSKCEGFPNSMIEAMAYGIPVVASDSPGGCRAIIGGSNSSEYDIKKCPYGILTPRFTQNISMDSPLSSQEKALAEAITYILSDEEEFTKFVLQSDMRAKDYAIDKVMKLWREIL